MPLHRETSGSGPNVLLVAGLNGQARFWRPVMSRLSSAFRLVAFDQRGCGASPDDGASWTIETMADDAADVAAAVFGDRPYAVVGHSTGGAIAQVMSARGEGGPRAVVLSGTWARAGGYFEALFRLRLALLDRAPDLDPVLGNLLRADPAEFRPPDAAVALDPNVTHRRIQALLGHRGDAIAAQITAPALVMAAADDRVVPLHLSHALAAALPAADVSVCEGGGHFFPQTRAEWFCDTVSAWLKHHLDQTNR